MSLAIIDGNPPLQIVPRSSELAKADGRESRGDTGLEEAIRVFCILGESQQLLAEFFRSE